MLAQIVHIIFLVYTILLMVRIIGSWFPRLAYSKFIRFSAFYTDPYLRVFRRIIPPIGGVFDLSPLLGFFGLQFMEHMLLLLFR